MYNVHTITIFWPISLLTNITSSNRSLPYQCFYIGDSFVSGWRQGVFFSTPHVWHSKRTFVRKTTGIFYFILFLSISRPWSYKRTRVIFLSIFFKFFFLGREILSHKELTCSFELFFWIWGKSFCNYLLRRVSSYFHVMTRVSLDFLVDPIYCLIKENLKERV